MGSKVFCGGLPWSTTDSELQTALAQFGEVREAKVITDRETGKSRGFGFVTFASDESAMQAVQAQTIDVGGRTVRIDSANDRPGGGGGGGGGAGGYRPPPRQDDRGGGPRRDDSRGGRPRQDDQGGRGGRNRGRGGGDRY